MAQEHHEDEGGVAGFGAASLALLFVSDLLRVFLRYAANLQQKQSRGGVIWMHLDASVFGNLTAKLWRRKKNNKHSNRINKRTCIRSSSDWHSEEVLLKGVQCAEDAVSAFKAGLGRGRRHQVEF